MSSLSVQGRITLIAGCCLLASAAALVASSLFNAARMQEQVLTSTTLEGQHAAENWMKAMGATQAARRLLISLSMAVRADSSVFFTTSS